MNATGPQCGMRPDCPEPVTHIGERGYIYCTGHAAILRGWENTRKMRPWELRLIEAGQRLPSYRPGPKPKTTTTTTTNERD